MARTPKRSGTGGGRRLKRRVEKLLAASDWQRALVQLCRLPPRAVVNPLFSFFYSLDNRLRWRSITAMGAVVAQLAEKDPESARVVMRRLMWNLNDESGGIGWGSPEAIGEIVARSRLLAEKYACILASYIRRDGNYLEHEPLQNGVLWGLARAAYSHPDLFSGAGEHLAAFLTSCHAPHRGLAAWAAGALNDSSLIPALRKLTGDAATLSIYHDNKMTDHTVAELASAALLRLSPYST